jgi:hypothetical protein
MAAFSVGTAVITEQVCVFHAERKTWKGCGLYSRPVKIPWIYVGMFVYVCAEVINVGFLSVLGFLCSVCKGPLSVENRKYVAMLQEHGRSVSTEVGT